MDTHLAFSIRRSAIKDGIFIPKYYDPELQVAVETARASGFETARLRELLRPGEDGSRLGHWIRREHYGSGDIPFVRTSDISQWRIRPDFKKGVSDAVYQEVRGRQDVQAHDLLFVAHGTYLVGTVGIVMPHETTLVLQDHVFRLRCGDGVSPFLLLALLSTSFVKRQVRSKQFSADIIDKIGERHLDLVVAIPRSRSIRDEVEVDVKKILADQTKLRSDTMTVAKSNLRMSRERAETRHGFTVVRKQIRNRIFIPKYYDPALDSDLKSANTKNDPWVTIQELVSRKLIRVSTGVEVGKLAYGTGDIPFIRTSDIAEWEIKRDVKQGVSQAIYDYYKTKAAVSEGDILIVRDGTYLVGSSAIVMANDVPALICGGMLRVAVIDKGAVDPFFLLGVLNYPLVRRQMRAKQFTRDVIDTLGHRFLEVQVPDPTLEKSRALAVEVGRIMTCKAEIKANQFSLVTRLEPPIPRVAIGRPAWSMR